MEILNYIPKPAELIVEFEGGTTKRFPIELVKQWCDEEEITTFEYGHRHDPETGELEYNECGVDFDVFYDTYMDFDYVRMFVDWATPVVLLTHLKQLNSKLNAFSK